MFRTELIIAPATGPLSRTARVLTMGSCFANSIGARLVANKVDTRVNPFGTVFQPLALVRLLRAAAGEEVDWQQHLVQARGRWQSYDLHASIGADSPVALLQHIQELVRQTGEFLRQANVVLLTLGTAWAYRLRETGELVSNCHKQPADLFVRELLTPDEVINALAETHAYLRLLNPNLRFVLTVSPVRHLKDTLPLNAVSKSVLRVATHILSDLLPGVAYFPAYELLVDDLRDYRFYDADMLHPSEVAEDYIWDKFARAYFDADFGRFRQEWAAVRQALGHRPLHAGAPEHRQFLESTREKLEQLSLRKVDVGAELGEVRTQLATLPMLLQLPDLVAEEEDGEKRIDIGYRPLASGAEEIVVESAAVADTPATVITDVPEQPAMADSRALRLSPEEFRAQRAARPSRPERGRRDGRGKGQTALPTENELFQVASLAAAELARPPFSAELTQAESQSIASAPEAVPDDAPATGIEEAATEAGRKKKRRSRGGAKRTARKHALRLATEMDLDESQLPASGAALAAAASLATGPASRSAGQKSSVITKSQPVKRGGRRQEPGEAPRVALFAAPAAEAAPEMPRAPSSTMTGMNAERPVLDREVAVNAPASLSGLAFPERGASEAPSRNSRNRNKKKTAKAPSEPGFLSTLPAAESTSARPIAPAGQPAGAALPVAVPEALPRANRRQATLPVVAVSVAAASATEVGTPTIPPVNAKAGNASRRAKSRAASGARAEKPAVDTPIIPAPDSTAPLTQVAAGRMTGTTAELIEPTAAAKKPAAKAAAAKTSTPRGKAPKATALQTAQAPVVPAAATPVATVVPKSEPGQKAKTAPKTKQMTRSTPTASVGAGAPPAPQAAAPAAAKPAAKSATAKLEVPPSNKKASAKPAGAPKATPKTPPAKAAEPKAKGSKATPVAKASAKSKTPRKPNS